ncbi:MAG TPA: acetate--CoA ligase family protein [bacterium]|nr:acetate--CoA ligase family protein [bacterium]
MIRAARPAGVFPDVSAMLAPKSIAVIGASDQPGNLGGTAVRYLQRFKYPGAIWPVNPRRQSVAGLACFPRPHDLPGPADLAILALSADSVVDMIRECAEAGIRHGIVWAGGFAEVGGKGIERQRALAAACRDTGFKLCGPNCIGIVDTHRPMTASFASSLVEMDELLPGNISMISQSGGMATVAQALAQRAGFGFRYVISTGNEAVLTTADFIHALVLDPKTKVIAAYLEGVDDGSKFVAALEEARAARKPLIILKGGATAASARAAVAHTGALVGEDRVWDAVFREYAAIRVHSQEELLDVAMFLSGNDAASLPAGNGVAALTFGGGSGVLSADQATQCGLATPPFSPQSVERLRSLVTPLASIANPIDLTPETYNQPSWLALLPAALDVVAADPNIHTLFFQCAATAHRAPEIIDEICALRCRTSKTVCVAWPLAPAVALERLPAEGIYLFPEIARAIRAIGQSARYRANLSRPPRAATLPAAGFDWAAFVADPAAGTVISEHQCHRLLAAAGLPTAAGRLARSPEEAMQAARAVGYPVAVKGTSAAVTHRAAAGLLALDVRSDTEVRDAFHGLVARAREVGVELEGLYVQHMVQGGLELLVSAFRDPVFGVMVSCGAGGNLTEVIGDVTLERAPVGGALALHMLERLRIVQHAARRAPAVDLRRAAEFVAQFSQLAITAPWRRFVLEVNPIRVSADDVVAVDGLLVVEEP